MAFITLEGIEGSGKSTQACRLAQHLGPDVVLTREPGGTELGRAIRGLLLDPANQQMADTTEVLLYFADRAQHVSQVIRPALLAGRTVISDRYVESSLAYQGYGRGIPLASLRSVADVATGGLRPDVIVFLDVPVEAGLHRIGLRGAQDRLEVQERAFHERVRSGYFELMAAEPERWLRVDGQGDPEAVERRVQEALAGRRLEDRLGVS